MIEWVFFHGVDGSSCNGWDKYEENNLFEQSHMFTIFMYILLVRVFNDMQTKSKYIAIVCIYGIMREQSKQQSIQQRRDISINIKTRNSLFTRLIRSQKIRVKNDIG